MRRPHAGPAGGLAPALAALPLLACHWRVESSPVDAKLVEELRALGYLSP